MPVLTEPARQQDRLDFTQSKVWVRHVRTRKVCWPSRGAEGSIWGSAAEQLIMTQDNDSGTEALL